MRLICFPLAVLPSQVGGLVGGVKLTRSPGTLPLSIHVEHVTAPAGFVEKFADHLVLIYTGKTRLARNLLQNVVRNWYVHVWEGGRQFDQPPRL